ncbi:MAG TPA: PA14 domain-containing protein [Promineifilum sp.]|nr:PA14 domain-containing protein [Promineifilum sp.]
MQLRLWKRAGWVIAGVLALFALMLGGRPAQAQDAQWLGQFWNNTSLSGQPVVTRWENAIDFNWFGGSPDARINNDQFSARWTRTVNFPAGTYRFFATMDDGMRIWIDNQLVIDSWTPSQEHTMTFDRSMNGNHALRIDYFEDGGQAVARFRWEPISSGSSSGQPFFPNWRAEYFNTPNLTGAPVLVRDDRYVNNNWGTASPGPGVNSDFWSVRWTRQITGQQGNWTIQLRSDDGSRIFINNQLILDNWFDARPVTVSTNFFNTGATLNVRVEFYDSYGPAFIQVNLIPPTGSTGGSGGGGTGGSGGSCTTAPSGMQAQNTATGPLNIRRGPSTQFEVMGTMASCQILPLSGFRSADSAWVQIVTTGGQTGWVSAQYVRLGVPISSLTPTN